MTVSQGGAGTFFDKGWITCDTTGIQPGLRQLLRRMGRRQRGRHPQDEPVHRRRALRGRHPRCRTPRSSVGSRWCSRAARWSCPSPASGLESFVSTNGGVELHGPVHHRLHPGRTERPACATAARWPRPRSTRRQGLRRLWHDCRFRAVAPPNDIVYEHLDRRADVGARGADPDRPARAAGWTTSCRGSAWTRPPRARRRTSGRDLLLLSRRRTAARAPAS